MVRAILATGVLLMAFAAPAAAIKVKNNDDKEHKITVIEGETKKDHVLKPTAVLEGICLKGCVIRLNDSDNDEYELEGGEEVSIEDGYLYYDSAEAPADTPADTSKAPPAPAPAPAPKP